jgi:DNA replication ATP-dependent helicase Dna2
VRSNAACNIGDLLRDWRRINVAFTRAKTKLLVIGSRETLKGSGEGEMLARFIGLIEERGWIYDLGVDALDAHHFEEGIGATASTQGSPVKGFGSSPVKSQGSPRPSVKKKSPKRLGPVTRLPTGKENLSLEPKKARIGQRALLKGKPILRDIFNDLVSGA